MSWRSVDPRTQQVVAYQPADNATLEAAYQANPRGKCVLTFPWGTFTVDFSSMRQVNATGGSRSVRRIDPNDAAEASASDCEDAASAAPVAPPSPLSDDVVAAARAAVVKMDHLCEQIEAKERDARFRESGAAAQLPLTEAEVQSVLAVYGHIIADLNSSEMRTRFGFNPAEVGHLHSHREGAQVPEYFANVSGGQSIFYRKLVSLLGMRNLVRGGLRVFASMLTQLFAGNVDAYGPRDGPNLMKYLTGNVVDLDTVVLRCSDPVQLRVINEMLRKQDGANAAQFGGADQLAASTFGLAMAHSQAHRLIDGFVERFALTPVEISRRSLALSSTAPRSISEVYTATNNADRGRAPLWLYRNVGVVSYHANVPAMADVYGALLRAPFHFVKAYLIAKVDKRGALPALTEFFEEALADTCFNQKWQAIESYLGARSREGAIFQVLSEYQAKRQDVFTAEFYARDDRSGRMELEMMIALVATQKPALMGIDPLTCLRRAITAADVREWYKAVVLASV